MNKKSNIKRNKETIPLQVFKSSHITYYGDIPMHNMIYDNREQFPTRTDAFNYLNNKLYAELSKGVKEGREIDNTVLKRAWEVWNNSTIFGQAIEDIDDMDYTPWFDLEFRKDIKPFNLKEFQANIKKVVENYHSLIPSFTVSSSELANRIRKEAIKDENQVFALHWLLLYLENRSAPNLFFINTKGKVQIQKA